MENVLWAILGVFLWLIEKLWNWLKDTWPWILGGVFISCWLGSVIKDGVKNAIEDSRESLKEDISEAVKNGVEQALENRKFR